MDRLCHFLLVLIALGILLAATSWRSGQSEGGLWYDSCEYLYGATTLFSGHGYRSLTGGPQTVFPPGYSIAIGLTNVIVRNPMISAQLVSSMASVLSVVPLVFIAARLFGKPTAVAAGSIYVVLPARLGVSNLIMTESLYILLVLLGTWLWLVEVASPVWLRSVAAGVCFGYACLTRPEAALCLLALVVCSVLPRQRWWKKPPLPSVVLICVAFAAVMLPYLVFLRAQTGNWQISGKQSSLQTVASVVAGSRYEELRKLDAGDTKFDKSVRAATLRQYVSGILRNLGIEYRHLRTILGTFLWPCLCLGLIVELRFGSNALKEAFPTLIALGFPLLYFPVLYPELRYVFLGVAALVILASWQFVRRFWPPEAEQPATLFRRVLALVPLVVLTLFVLKGGRGIITAKAKPDEAEVVARWLNTQLPGRDRIMTSSIQVAYYSGRTFLPLPYDDLGRVLHYASNHRVRFFLLLGEDNKWTSWSEDLQLAQQRGQLAVIAKRRGDSGSQATLYKVSGI